MLTSLVLRLRPQGTRDLPMNLGRASHALFLRLAAARDPALAEALHATDGMRPFTCSNLVGGRRRAGRREIGPQDETWLRFTGLTSPVSGVLASLAEEPPAEAELDGQPFAVEAATLDPVAHPWAGSTSYADLVARHLLGTVAPRRKLRLDFASPTTFRSGGRNLPLPLPHLVFGSLLGRWQGFAPTAVSADATRYVEEMVALARYTLRTRMLPFKDGGMQVGFVGSATFVALNNDRYWLNILGLLADYAFYAGIGYQTAVGMGQARRGEERRDTVPLSP